MRCTGVLIALILILMVSTGEGRASEIRDLYRGSRMQAMGGAHVGLADDEQAIFVNPAGLAGFERKEMHFLVSDSEFSEDAATIYSDNADTFSSPSISNLSNLMGYNVYAREQFTPSLIVPNFGLALLMDYQGAFYGKNLALPQITLGWQSTNGIQLVTGFTLTRGRPRIGKGELRGGVGLKVLYRRGGYKRIPINKLFQLTQGKAILHEVATDYQMGLGADVGFQYYYPLSKKVSLSLGTSYTEIGDINFGEGPSQQKGNLSIGAAFKYKTGFFNMAIAYDYRNILEEVDWRQKNHFGVELGLPIFSFYGGINQVYVTYGAAMDLGFLRIMALSYAQELGTFVRQDPNRRYMLKLDFKFDI